MTEQRLTKENILDEFYKTSKKIREMKIAPMTFYIDVSFEDCKEMYDSIRGYPFEQIAFLDDMCGIKKIVKRKDWKY